MRMMDTIAYVGTVIGIGGIAGAIEKGTSLIVSVACLGVGCICMRWSYKRGERKQNEEKNNCHVAAGIHGGKHSITGRGKGTGAS